MQNILHAMRESMFHSAPHIVGQFREDEAIRKIDTYLLNGDWCNGPYVGLLVERMRYRAAGLTLPVYSCWGPKEDRWFVQNADPRGSDSLREMAARIILW